MQNVDYFAYSFRIEYGLDRFPLDYKYLLPFLRGIGFTVKTYIQADKEIRENGYTQYAKENNAFTIVSPENNETIIYIDDTLPLPKKTKILLHEVGHIYLKHTYCGILGNSGDDYEKTIQESEATQFALSVIAPPRIMLDRKITTLDQLCEETLLSPDDAAVVLGKIKRLPPKLVTDTENMLRKLMRRKRPIHNENIVIGSSLISIFVLIVILGLASSLGAFTSPALAEQDVSSLPSDPLPSVLLSSQDVSGDVSDITSGAAGGTMTSDTTTSRESATQPNTTGTATEPAVPNNPVSQYTPQYSKSSSWVYTYHSKPATPLSGVMVCVTQAGDKYHLEGCPHLDGHSYTKMDRSTAKDEGLEPCLTCSPDSAQASGAAVTSSSAPTSSKWVQFNLNTATLEQIKSVPGLSESAAENIYEFRQKAGYFDNFDQILNVPGCGYATRNLLKEYCYVER